MTAVIWPKQTLSSKDIDRAGNEIIDELRNSAEMIGFDALDALLEFIEWVPVSSCEFDLTNCRTCHRGANLTYHQAVSCRNLGYRHH